VKSLHHDASLLAFAVLPVDYWPGGCCGSASLQALATQQGNIGARHVRTALSAELMLLGMWLAWLVLLVDALLTGRPRRDAEVGQWYNLSLSRGKEGNSGGHRSHACTAMLCTKCITIINMVVLSLSCRMLHCNSSWQASTPCCCTQEVQGRCFVSPHSDCWWTFSAFSMSY
jgi:hypothetical protein